jgi:hypothetical protein
MRSQGLWDDAKDSEEKRLLAEIGKQESKLKRVVSLLVKLRISLLN